MLSEWVLSYYENPDSILVALRIIIMVTLVTQVVVVLKNWLWDRDQLRFAIADGVEPTVVVFGITLLVMLFGPLILGLILWAFFL